MTAIKSVERGAVNRTKAGAMQGFFSPKLTSRASTGTEGIFQHLVQGSCQSSRCALNGFSCRGLRGKFAKI